MKLFLIELVYPLFCIIVFLGALIVIPFIIGVRMLELLIDGIINKSRRKR